MAIFGRFYLISRTFFHTGQDMAMDGKQKKVTGIFIKDRSPRGIEDLRTLPCWILLPPTTHPLFLISLFHGAKRSPAIGYPLFVIATQEKGAGTFFP